jgi:hypothetical protein
LWRSEDSKGIEENIWRKVEEEWKEGERHARDDNQSRQRELLTQTQAQSNY